MADKLEGVLGFDRTHTTEVVQQIARAATIVRPVHRVAVVSDEADNRILGAAGESGADFIVLGDRHLLDLGEWEGIRVVRVAEFVVR